MVGTILEVASLFGINTVDTYPGARNDVVDLATILIWVPAVMVYYVLFTIALLVSRKGHVLVPFTIACMGALVV